ncbi:MAG: amino acid permease [Ignavibacteria bacterium]|nr:amino acid permease [Ignavibacteria bacterium]
MAEQDFRKRLSVFDLTMIVIGTMIGSGIFLTPSLIVRHLGDARLVYGIWILGGVMAAAGALTFAELSNVHPRVGGIYAYLTEAYHPSVGFAYGWCMLLVMNSGSLAALCTACITYVAYFFPMTAWAQKFAATGVMLVLTAVNIAGVRQGSAVSNVFSMTKILGIAAIILGALFIPHAAPVAAAPVPPPANLGTALAMAMVGVLWSYGGWQYATFPAGEVRAPGRSIPLSILLGVGLIILLYLGANTAYLTVLPLDAIAGDSRVASLTAERLVGPAGGTFIAVLIALSTFGTASVYTLAAPRIYYAMARDGVFFRSVATLHPRRGTPVRALLLQLAAVTALIFSGSFEELISYVAFVDWIFYALAAGAVFIFRRTHARAERRYRTPGYPVTPAFFILVSLCFVGYLFYNETVKSGIGLAILLASAPAYLLWKRRRRSDAA